VTAFADPQGAPEKAHAVFGAGIYLARDGELEPIGDDAIRMVELAPAMRARLCAHPAAKRAECTELTNLGATPQRFAAPAGVSRLEVIPLVVAYRDARFGGASQAFEVGQHSNDAGQLAGVGNDQIGSLRIAAGLSVRACQHEKNGEGTGTCSTLLGSTGALAAELDDQISFLEILPAALAWSDPRFGGASIRFESGEALANRSELNGVGNDEIEALQVNPGAQLEVCTDELAGLCKVFQKSAAELPGELNRAISSVQARRAVVTAPFEWEEVASGPFVLRARASDVDTAAIGGNALRWSSARQGSLGYGERLAVTLDDPGCGKRVEDELTLEATGKRGVQKVTRRVTVRGVCTK
jgi:hypothetical protein